MKSTPDQDGVKKAADVAIGPPPALLTVPELARELRISRAKAYELVMASKIRSLKIGAARRVPREAMLEFIKTQSAA